MKRQIVAIKDMSAGNETVGEMWQETAIFDIDTPVSRILEWAGVGHLNESLKKRLTITLPEEITDG